MGGMNGWGGRSPFIPVIRCCVQTGRHEGHDPQTLCPGGICGLTQKCLDNLLIFSYLLSKEPGRDDIMVMDWL